MSTDPDRSRDLAVAVRMHLDSRDVGADLREEFVRAAITGSKLPVELRSPRGAGIDLRLEAVDYGPVTVQSMDISPTSATRDSRMARDDSPPCVFVQMKSVGVSTLVQQDREAVFGPGNVVLVHSGWPSVVSSTEHSQRRVVRIPVERLALPEDKVRRAMAVPVSRDLPLAGVLTRYVEGLPLSDDVPSLEGEHLGRAAVDLVRGLVDLVVGDALPLGRAPTTTLQLHLVDYLHGHWREHDLTVDRLAAVHHVSVRQVYRLLEAEGISLGDWLRQRRLEACRDELAAPGALRSSVAAVGRRWGYPDATNFGRAFKRAFGTTPQQWRSLHQPQRS